MKCKTAKLLVALVIFCLVGNIGVSASNTIAITNVEVSENHVTIIGTLGVGNQQVSCMVTDTNDKIAYINQTAGDADGNFTFECIMPDWATSGTYTVKCGGEAENSPANATFVYETSSSETPASTIEIVSAIIGESGTITVTGNIDGGGKQVSCMVTDINEKIAYINQTASDSNGNFTFAFSMPDWAETGTYTVQCGGEAANSPASRTFEYVAGKEEEPPATERKLFIDADVTVSINSYVPTISGTISCTENKTIMLNLLNKTDNAIIASETITSQNGVFNLSYTLPSLLKAKDYEFILSCTDNGVNLASVSVSIDASLLELGVTGSVATADNVEVDATLQTVNTGLLDKSLTFSGSRNVSVTIPNILSNASFHLTAKGYEAIEISTPDDTEKEEIEILGTNTDENGKTTVTGKIDGGVKQISCLVTDSTGKIAYINQTASDINGNFTFEFSMPDWAETGTYTIQCGGEADNSPASYTFAYEKIETEPPATIQITSANVDEAGNISVTGTSYGITGQINCVLSAENGRVINNAVTEISSDGSFTFSFVLPVWEDSGTYSVVCSGDSLSAEYTLTYNKAPVIIEEINIDKNVNKPLYTALMTECRGLDPDKDGIITSAELNILTGSLDLSNKNISDISGLQALTGITDLYLNNNKIENIDVLANLPNLKRLDVSNNNISVMNSIPKNLVTLHLENNNVSNADIVGRCRDIVYLFADGNNISNIEFLKVMTNIKTLSMANNNISDISPVATLVNMKYLNLSDNEITDITALSSCTALLDVRLSNNNFKSIQALRNRRFFTLYVDGNGISSTAASVLNALVKKY